MWLLWLFVAVPIIEIALFIQIGGLIGLWPTLALVILAAILGLAVVRSQGQHAWIEAQRSFSELRDPSRPLAHGAMILAAGMLLVIPGFFTDAIGLLLLIPAVRDMVMRYFSRRVQVRRVQSGQPGFYREPHRPPYADGVIDGDYVVEDEPTPTRPRTPPDLPTELGDQDQPPRPGRSGWTRH